MNFSCLSQEEVRRKYREADDKNYIIGVIAGLTCTSETEVMRFLGIKAKQKRNCKECVRVDREKALELYDAGHTDKEIADALGVTRSAVGYWRRGIGLKINTLREENDEERMALYRKGLNDSEIGRILGCTHKTIYTWRQSRNLPANATRGGDHRKKKEVK